MQEHLDHRSMQQILPPFSERLLGLANLLIIQDHQEIILSPAFVGKVLSLSTRLEEFLDYVGAKRNKIWFPFRESTASVKLFSNVLYLLMHIRAACPNYQLMDNISEFLDACDEQLAIIRNALGEALDQLYSLAVEHEIGHGGGFRVEDFVINKTKTKLPHNREQAEVEDPEAVVVSMATSFLNLFSETEILNLSEEREESYPGYIPDQIDERSMRSLEVQFHNLQSLYDTRLASTNIESHDRRLPLIRGHASVIFHLLEVATHLIHHYERHMQGRHAEESHIRTSITEQQILSVVFRHCLKYADDFLESSSSLCREVIASYAEQGEIEVKVPSYRGFHVRPSTLVAKIVQHYGSDVQLSLSGSVCAADQPMELFRVNEKINAEKRKSLAVYTSSLEIADLPPGLGNPQDIARAALRELIDNDRIVTYRMPLDIPKLEKAPAESAVEYINRIIAQLLAEAQIDIRTDITVRFSGDKRVLRDIQILAENGYGEDSFGNNIMLPKELSYLKR